MKVKVKKRYYKKRDLDGTSAIINKWNGRQQGDEPRHTSGAMEKNAFYSSKRTRTE
jgi:hypothetical protein